MRIFNNGLTACSRGSIAAFSTAFLKGFFYKLNLIIPGKLAACCKPSSGAVVVWMDTLLIGPDSNSGQKNVDRIKESFQTASLPGCRPAWKPEESKPEESLCKVQPQIKRGEALECKVAGSIPTDDEVFLAILRFEARDNDDNSHRVPTQSWLSPNHCKLWQNCRRGLAVTVFHVFVTGRLYQKPPYKSGCSGIRKGLCVFLLPI